MQTSDNGSSTTSDPLPSESPRERSATLWFDDGNVVLQTNTKEYRVHRSVLASHSSVFRDMFSVPQPESQETVDRCPVVHVTDSAQDWDILFAAMYGNQMVGTKLGPIPLETLRASLVLGSKYAFEQYRIMALSQLEKLFPETLTDWDAIIWIHDSGDHYWGEWIQLLELVLSFGHRSMLPAAYFTCISNHDEEYIFHEILKERDRPIPTDSLKQLVLCRGRLIRALGNDVLKWCWDGSIPSKNCLDSTRCRQTLSPYFRKVTQSPLGIQGLLDEFHVRRMGLIDLCSNCKVIAATEHNKGRYSAWGQLPECFGLGDWRSLED